MPPTPRPDMLTWSCVGLLVAPAISFIIAGAGFLLNADEGMVGPAGLGAALSLICFLPLLIAEYHAVIRCNEWAASLIAYLALYGTVLGSIGWLVGLLEILRIKSPGPKPMSPWEFVFYSVFLTYVAAVGLGHLRWRKILESSSTECDVQGN